MDAFEKYANGRLKPRCMNCEKKKKKYAKGMRVCVECGATLPDKAFLKYDDGHYHKKCKQCEKKKKKR